MKTIKQIMTEAGHNMPSPNTRGEDRIAAEIEAYSKDIKNLEEKIATWKSYLEDAEDAVKKYKGKGEIMDKFMQDTILYNKMGIIFNEEELKMCNNIISRLQKLK